MSTGVCIHMGFSLRKRISLLVTGFSHAAGVARIFPRPPQFGHPMLDLTSFVLFLSFRTTPLSDHFLRVDSKSEAKEQKRSIFKFFTEIVKQHSRKSCANLYPLRVNENSRFPESCQQ